MEPVISVVMPIYNAERYLQKAVGSVLDQTFTDFELLLIDDGSSDNSYNVCLGLSKLDSRIFVFHQENRGVSAARAKGVECSRGRYIFFMDADDTVENSILEILSEKMFQGYDLVFCESHFTGEISGSEFVRGVLEQSIPVVLWGRMIKKSLLNNQMMELPSFINVGEDLALNLKLGLVVEKVYSIAGHYYNYIYNPESVMAKRRLSLKYETAYHEFVNCILGEKKAVFLDSYRYLQLSSFEGLMNSNVVIDYNIPWIKDLINNCFSMHLNRSQWLMLHVHNPFVCRCLFRISNWLRTLLKVKK